MGGGAPAAHRSDARRCRAQPGARPLVLGERKKTDEGVLRRFAPLHLQRRAGLAAQEREQAEAEAGGSREARAMERSQRGEGADRDQRRDRPEVHEQMPERVRGDASVQEAYLGVPREGR